MGEIHYLGRSNIINLQLKAEVEGVATAQDLGAAGLDVTQIDAIFEALGVTIESTLKATGPITWDQAGYETGEIRIDLSVAQEADIVASDTPYTVIIVVYNADNLEGIVWGNIGVVVKDV